MILGSVDGGAWARALAGATLAALIPARLLGDHLGPHDIVGLETDARWRALLEAAQLRHDPGAWVRGAGGGVGAFDVTPVPTALQALLGAAGVDAGQAWGWTLAVGVWLAGVGAWRLARRHGAGVATASGCALLVQVSPVVLGAVPEASLAAISVGVVALGFADARWAWLACGWSVPGAVAMSLFGVVEASRGTWAAAALRVVPALALGGVVLARSLQGTAPERESTLETVASVEGVAPAYVGEGNAVFPLPEGEAVSVRAAAWRAGTGLWLPAGVAPTGQGNPFAGPTPDSGGGGGHPLRNASPVAAPQGTPAPPSDDRPAWGVALVPLQRLHLGPAVVLAVLAGAVRAWRSGRSGARTTQATERRGRVRHRRAQRGWTVVAVAGIVGMCIAFGFAAAPGELVHDPGAGERLAGWWAGPEAGWRVWAAPVLAACVVGIAVALEGLGLGWRALVVMTGVAASVGLENPRLRSFGTPLPPDPVLTALAALPVGEVLVFPAPAAPWRQGQRPASRLAWELAEAGRSAAPASDEVDAWTVALSRASGAPVDIAAAERAWAVRAVELAMDTTPRYLLVDATALTPVGLVELERWLTPRMGAPVARSDARLLYDRTTFLAGEGRR